MLLFRKTLEMPSPDEALPGRPEPIPTPDTSFTNGRRIKPPFPDGMELAQLGLGCFWGAEKAFWNLPGVHVTAVGYAAGSTPNPTYEEVCSGRTGHNEVVLVVFEPDLIGYEEILRTFWEAHDPTQGMRQGNDVGTQYRSGIYTSSETQAEQALASRGRVPGCALFGRLWPHHHRDPRSGPLLLRRGLPPAVPRQEPVRLLRPRGHRGRLSDRRRSLALTALQPATSRWSLNNRSNCSPGVCISLKSP